VRGRASNIAGVPRSVTSRPFLGSEVFTLRAAHHQYQIARRRGREVHDLLRDETTAGTLGPGCDIFVIGHLTLMAGALSYTGASKP
jgi:hypothetical protein